MCWRGEVSGIKPCSVVVHADIAEIDRYDDSISKCKEFIIESDATIVAPLVFGWLLNW